MGFRFFRKQRQGVDRMGHYGSAVRVPSQALLGDSYFLAGSFSAVTDFDSRSVGLGGPGANNLFVGRWNEAAGGQWVSRIYSDAAGFEPINVVIEPDVDGVYVSVVVFSDNTGPLTTVSVTLENSDGTVGATVATTLAAVGTLRPSQVIVAKYDNDGFLLWAKLLWSQAVATPINDEPFSARLRGMNVASSTKLQIIGGFGHQQVGAANTSLRTIEFGPGEADQQDYTAFRNSGYNYGVALDKATGEIVAGSISIIGPSTGIPGSFNGMNDASGIGMGNFARSDGAWVHPGHTSTHVTKADLQSTPVSFADPTVIISPGTVALIGSDNVADWAFRWDKVSGAVVIQASFDAIIHPSDGGLFMGYTSHPGAVSQFAATTSVANQILVTTTNFEPVLIRYDEAGDLSWAKRYGASNSVFKVASARGASIYDPVDDAYYLSGLYGGVVTMTWGPGEAGAVAYTYTGASSNSGLAKHDDATGDLLWATPFDSKTGGGVVANGILLKGGEIIAALDILDTATVDALNNPTVISASAALNSVVSIVHLDAATGAYVSDSALWDWVTANATLAFAKPGF